MTDNPNTPDGDESIDNTPDTAQEGPEPDIADQDQAAAGSALMPDSDDEGLLQDDTADQKST